MGDILPLSGGRKRVLPVGNVAPGVQEMVLGCAVEPSTMGPIQDPNGARAHNEDVESPSTPSYRQEWRGDSRRHRH